MREWLILACTIALMGASVHFFPKQPWLIFVAIGIGFILWLAELAYSLLKTKRYYARRKAEWSHLVESVKNREAQNKKVETPE